MKHLLTPAFAAALLAVPAAAQMGETATAQFVDGDGESIGQATLTQTNSGVLIEMDVEGLPSESWIAFHVHEGGVCDPEDDFETAAQHFSPSNAQHGFFVEGGTHEGVMPNQYVPENGVLRVQVLNAMVSLDGTETDIRGRTLILHEGPDDYVTQPDGDAGDRIACAVIE